MWERFGTLIISAAFLFAAVKVHRSMSRHARITKPLGLILAFIAGLTFIVSVVGTWMASFAEASGVIGVVGLGICVVIIGVDWGLDGRPDRMAFWASFLLPLFIVVGWTQIPVAMHQINRGGHEVTTEMSKTGK